jgi:hypothetical protein
MTNGRRNQHPWELWVLFGIGIAVISLTLVIGLIYLVGRPQPWWNWLFTGGELDGSKYLLSATAQVLGALFALVFTITLIAVQFVTKYTHRTMKIIFNERLIFYMTGFACSVILPLWWLLNPTELGTYISIVTGSLVVLSLILLFLDLKKRMNIGWIITCLKVEGLKAVADKNFDKARDNIEALDNISMGAYGDNNYDVLDLATEALIRFSMEMEEQTKEVRKEGTDEHYYHNLIFDNLNNTLEEAINNTRVPTIVMSQLGKVASDAVRKNLISTWKLIRDLETKTEKMIVEESSRPVYYKEAMSSYAARILYLMAMAKEETNKINDQEIKTIHNAIEIHRRHLKKGWLKFSVLHLRRTVDLALKFRCMIEMCNFSLEHPLSLSIVPRHLFEYLDYWKEKGEPSNVNQFCTEIEPLVSTLRNTKTFTQLKKFLADNLKNYGDIFLSKGGTWYSAGRYLLDHADSLAK